LPCLLPALALQERQQRCGATDALRAGLARVSHRPPLQMLLLGWCLGLFREGAAGFGTPIALVAPLLVGLGLPALTAVVLALPGHAAGVCFGALGSFVTGSATASNVLFSSLQAQTAQALGLAVAWLLAAQTLGAAVGNIVCPHNIVAGAAKVGLAGREAEVLRRTWLPCLVYLLLAGGLVALVLRL
jgi:lactate permease